MNSKQSQIPEDLQEPRQLQPEKAQPAPRKKKKRRRLLVVLLAVVAGLCWIGYSYARSQMPEGLEVLEVNGQHVYASEAMVYYKIMRLEYEEELGENIWDYQMLGVDPDQMAMDRVMESMIRIKVIQGQRYTGPTASQEEIDSAVEKLSRILGEDYKKAHGISDSLLTSIVTENYMAYEYEQNANFIFSGLEDEIEQNVEETFGVYDEAEFEENYLQTAIVRPIMFYTGQWVEGEWVSYPDVQKEQILAKAEAVHDALTISNYSTYAADYGDDISCVTNPVFNQGYVINEDTDKGYVYRGQISEEASDAIFALSVGQISDIIETTYGYLIVESLGFPVTDEADHDSYAEQLNSARASFRLDIVGELKASRLEEELDRMISQSSITRYDQRLAEYIRDHYQEE